MLINYLTYMMMAFAMLSFVSIALGNVLLGLATALFLVYVYKNGIKIEEEHKGYFYAYGFFVFTLLLSALFSGDLIKGLKEWLNLCIWRAMPFFIIVLAIKDAARVKKILAASLVGITIGFLCIGYQAYQGSLRAAGFYGHPMTFGGFLCIYLPLISVRFFESLKLKNKQTILSAVEECLKIIKKEKIEHPIVYIMACRIGPFAKYFYKRIHALGGRVFVNPDGHEWKRAKWNYFIRKYWKFSEKLMIKYCDLVICDSINIEKYIHESYDGKGINGVNPNTTYISYGAETRKSKLADDDPKVLNWYNDKGLVPNEYYLVVGRFVPENNYETMIREFMKSNSTKNFALITNVNDKFLNELEKKLHFRKDVRIKFVGTVYDQELLMKIREKAFAYLHGHEVGGTNPSLLEALGSTNLNLLLDVGFNREVAENTALYWSKDKTSLCKLIEMCDAQDYEHLGIKAKKRIKNAYSWLIISKKYEKIWII